MGRIKDEAFFQMVHDYLKIYLPNQMCASSNTVRAYRTALDQLIGYAASASGISISEVTFGLLDSGMVSGYLDWLVAEKGCSASTRNHRFACIRSFFRYAAAANPENIVLLAGLDRIPRQKQEKFSGVDYMSETAVKALLEQPDTKTRRGVRDQFFMILMYDSAARIQEMLDLRVCDIRLGNTPAAVLKGKGSKIRSVPLMPETINHFRNYMKLFHPDGQMHSQQPLFYVEQCGARHPMSDDNVRKFLRRYGASARRNCPEVPENVHPHLWRHSRAMHLYQHGMALSLISQWLGHSNLETTLVYAYADTEQKRRAIEKSMGRDVIAGVDLPKYSVSDEEVLKKLYGLK